MSEPMNVLPELYPQRFWASVDASMILGTLKKNRDPLYSLIRAAENRNSYLAGGFARELFMLNIFLQVEFIKQRLGAFNPSKANYEKPPLDVYLFAAGDLEGSGLDPEDARNWSSNAYYRDMAIEGLSNLVRRNKEEIDSWISVNGFKVIRKVYQLKRVQLASDIDIFSLDRQNSNSLKMFLSSVYYGDSSKTAFKARTRQLRTPVFSDTFGWNQSHTSQSFSSLDYRNEELSRPDVQLINDPQNRLGERVFGNPISTVDGFDISAIRVALHKGKFIIDLNSFGDIVTGNARLVNIGNNPLAEVARLNKYSRKGFFVNHTEFAKILLHTESLSEESKTKMYSKLLSNMAFSTSDDEARDSKGMPYIGKNSQDFDSRYLQARDYNYPQKEPLEPQTDGDWEDLYAAFFGEQV